MLWNAQPSAIKWRSCSAQGPGARCAACGAQTPAAFPDWVAVPAQYGKRIGAVVLYLLQYQLLPEKRDNADREALTPRAFSSKLCKARRPFQHGWDISDPKGPSDSDDGAKNDKRT